MKRLILVVAGGVWAGCVQAPPVADSVVRMAGTACLNPIIATGIILEDGLVLTVAHAIAGADDDLRVISPPDNVYPVEVVGFDPEMDLALLRAEGLVGGPVVFADPVDGESGHITVVSRDNDVEKIGYTVLRLVNARSGDIYDQGRIERDAIDISADIAKGDSGGPLVSEQGEITGMVFAVSKDRESAGYALAASEIQAFIDGADPSTTTERGTCR